MCTDFTSAAIRPREEAVRKMQRKGSRIGELIYSPKKFEIRIARRGLGTLSRSSQIAANNLSWKSRQLYECRRARISRWRAQKIAGLGRSGWTWPTPIST
jgi:hypothetical protein